MDLKDWRRREAEEFRARVLQQAILLGFEAEEQPNTTGVLPHWKYKAPNGLIYTNYAGVYAAALEFLCLLNFPEHLIGRVNTNEQDGGPIPNP